MIIWGLSSRRLFWVTRATAQVETGEEIFVRYKGEPSKERYEFIRDYLDFKLKRMK
jgi:hypothetical protein